MTVAHCAVCSRPSPDAYLCPGCTRQLTRELRTLPAWLAELDTTAQKQARLDTAIKRPPGAGQPLPFHIGAADLRQRARGTLGGHAHAFAGDWHITPPAGARTPTFWARWLSDRSPALPNWPRAASLLDDLQWLTKTIRHTIDRIDPEVFAGRCDAPDVRADIIGGKITPRVSTCGADLYGRLGQPHVTCQTCGHRYDVHERQRQLLASVTEIWHRAFVIANGLTSLGQPVTQQHIADWVRHGKLAPVVLDDDGEPLYRVGDIQDLVIARMKRIAEWSRPA